jgi:hypothetical protein
LLKLVRFKGLLGTGINWLLFLFIYVGWNL